jgi:hypothetical protein
MARKSVHTVRRGSGWGNLSSGKGKVPKVYRTKAQAQAAGRKTAIRTKAEHVVHNRNGRIGSANSYGGDPHPPSG